MTAPTDNTSERDELLAKMRAFKSDTELVIMEDGSLDSLTPLKDALQAYISKRVEEARIMEHAYRNIPHDHKYTIDLGDPCYCGSDNCAMCELCGDENHD